MKTMNQLPNAPRTLASLLLLLLLGSAKPASAYSDTTVFRIRVLQDTVYAGQPIDVEFYVEKERNGITIPSILQSLLGQFEMEVVTDTSRIAQHRTRFEFDQPSLAAFFNTLFPVLQTSSALDPVLGALNMKVKSNKGGSGAARVGKGQYIVQDNAAGRQQMQFSFSKAVARGLLGINFPVKVITDSVFVIGEPTPIVKQPVKPKYTTPWLSREAAPDAVRLYPNPVIAELQLQGPADAEFRLMSLQGQEMTRGLLPESGVLTLDLAAYDAGWYVILFRKENTWESYKIVKQ